MSWVSDSQDLWILTSLGHYTEDLLPEIIFHIRKILRIIAVRKFTVLDEITY